MKKIIFFAVLVYSFSLVAPIYIYPQDTPSLDELLESESLSPSSSKAEKLIKDIEIEGNKSISKSTILSKIKTRINQPYFSRVVKDDIKRLYDTGFFSDVSIDSKDYDDGLKVIITVLEKPLVGEIIFEGMYVLRKDLMIDKHLKTKSGQYLDYNQLREDKENIKSQYQKKGYSRVVVDYKIKIDEETNKANVVFVVKENVRLRIRRVYIQGNDELDESKLLGAMKTRAARIFHAGFFKEGEFTDDLERLKILYISEGFPDVTVDSRFEYDEKGFMYIYILVNEGGKYTIGDVRIVGNEHFTTEELKEALEETAPGSVFSEVALQQDVFNLRSFYLNKGYLFVQVDESASIDPDTGKVDISYNIIENDIVYVGRIDVVGNTKTKDKVIRREVRLKPGEKFDGDKLRRSKERIDNLGFFQEVVFDTEPSSLPDRQDLVVEVKEAQTGSFSFGGGYSSVDQFIGFFEVKQKNFDISNFPNFTGGGQDLLLRWEIGSVRENFELSFTEPWLFDKPLSFGFDAYRRVHDKETDVGYGYNEERTGGALRLGKELSEYLRGTLTYRIEEIDISDVDADVSGELKKEIGSNILSSVEVGLTRDTRDNKFNPTKGTVLSGSAGITGGPFGGDKDFLKLFGLFSKYFSFWEKSVIEAKLRTGALLTFDDTHDIPIYERFYAGGAYSIRGYNERKVGPIDTISEDPIGGESLLVFNLEYTYALMDFIKLATFFDVGNVWRKVEDFGSGDLKSSIGVGVRIKTPIGPIKLDYGFPLNTEPGEEDKEGQFHFSMSRSF